MRRAKPAWPYLVVAALVLGGCGTPRDAWVLTMKRTLPGQICQSSIFAACFDVSSKQCQRNAEPIVEQCAEEVQAELPDTIGMSDGAYWGRKIGECAGERLYELQAPVLELTNKCEKVLLKQFGPERFAEIRAEHPGKGRFR